MQYVCRLGTAEGRVIEQVHHGGSVATLRAELERKGFHVFEIQAKGVSKLAMPRFGRRAKSVPIRSLLLFNQELAALLAAGLPLLQALDLVLERLREPEFRAIVEQVRERIKSGSELSDAFAEFSDQLPPLYPPTLKAGERSGEMETVIRRFIRYQVLVMDARRRVISALVYPAVLICLAFAMIAVMTLYVIPRFTVFYADFNAELPLLTRMILGISDFFRDNWLLLFAGAAVGAFFFSRWRRTPEGLVAIDRFKIHLPVVGTIFHRMALAELCRSLSTLLAGGIPLLSALDTAVGSIGNLYIRAAMEPTIQQVREGSSYHEALESTGEAEDIVISMVKVGEATGALDVMLTNVSDFFDQETETRLQRLLSLIEPAMLVFMGVVIAVLLLSVYLPMFGAMSQLPG